MKICFVGADIIPPKDGAFVSGLANNVVRLAKGLIEDMRYIRHKEREIKLYLFKNDLTYDE